MDFAQRLAFLLERDKVSRGKLARTVEVHTSTVTNWLSGMEPKLEKLVRVASFFNVPVAYLTGDTDDPSDKSLTHWAELLPEENKKPTTVSGSGQIPNYSKLSDTNKSIVDSMIAQLLAAQSNDQ